MIISKLMFQLIVTLALVVTIISPIVLIIFWVKDWKDRKLW
jgi:hypothetical protein